MVTSSTANAWPDLAAGDWEATRQAIHLWSQVAGKVRLALEPMINHWWQVTYYLSARGLTTSLMHSGPRGVEIEFDFLDHVVAVTTTDRGIRRLELKPQSVADFYGSLWAALAELGVEVTIMARPVEMVDVIPFASDTRLLAYDPPAAERFFRALVLAHGVMTEFRGRYIGKVSPVHFFWGGADLAVTRFSGRRAPRHPGGVPNCPDWVTVEGYSHEVSSCGFWPGGDAGGSFYAYAYPEPAGFAERAVQPDAAYYDRGLGEFLLPYEAVRTAAEPDRELLAFFQSTYEAVAELAEWDRENLEANRTEVRR